MNKRIYLIKKVTYFAITILVMIGCQDMDAPAFGEFEFDPPEVLIIYPSEGTEILDFQDTTSIVIEIEINDDVQVSEVTVDLDGTTLATFNDFYNNRHISETYTHNGLVAGDYTLTVTSTDIEGTSTITVSQFSKVGSYVPLYDGEVFYMSFDNHLRELLTEDLVDVVGDAPDFADSGHISPSAYNGKTDSYITFPSGDLTTSDEFSATFWYKVSADPGRAGLLVIGDDTADRWQGFRLFREGNDDDQTIKLNVGIGTDESWNDGGVIDVTAGEWVHIAFTISQTESKVYFNGTEMTTSALSAPIDWTGVGPLTIGSGGDTFSYWDHKSDSSDMDELRTFNKALSSDEVNAVMNGN